MKLLTQYSDINEASKVYGMLRESGIMSEITSASSYMLSQTKTGAVTVGLWVVFDNQYEDAVKLLKNPNHIPEHMLTLDEMIEIEENAHKKQLNSTQKIIEKLLTWLFSLLLITGIGYIVLGIINEQ